MQDLYLKFLRDEGGATAIEYGLIAGGIAVVIAGTVSSIGPTLKAIFASAATAF